MLKIVNFLKYTFEFLKFIIELQVKIVPIIISAFNFVSSAFLSLPTSLKVFLILIVVVSIVYKVISLGGSGE